MAKYDWWRDWTDEDKALASAATIRLYQTGEPQSFTIHTGETFNLANSDKVFDFDDEERI